MCEAAPRPSPLTVSLSSGDATNTESGTAGMPKRRCGVFERLRASPIVQVPRKKLTGNGLCQNSSIAIPHLLTQLARMFDRARGEADGHALGPEPTPRSGEDRFQVVVDRIVVAR